MSSIDINLENMLTCGSTNFTMQYASSGAPAIGSFLGYNVMHQTLSSRMHS